MKKCLNCSAEVPDRDVFCRICGSRLIELPNQLAGQISNLKTKICPLCSYENREYANFCARCGSNLVVETSSLGKSFPISTSPVTQQPSILDYIEEAFVTLVRPTPPVARPTDVVYRTLQSYSSIKGYLVLGVILFLAGMILSTSGLFLEAPFWFLIAVSAPPLVYVFWIYRQDRGEGEPGELVVFSVGWGAFSAFLVLLFWSFFFPDIGIPSWIGGPLVEEPIKILGVYWLATNRRIGRELNNHLDGMVYGAAVGGGFAIAENFLYVAYMVGQNVPFVWAVLVRATIGHVFYSALVGRCLGLAKVRKGRITATDLIPGLVVAMVLHGLWNSSIIDPVLSFFDSIAGDFGVVIGIFLAASPYYWILQKYVREALRDERLWGYGTGHAPLEN